MVVYRITNKVNGKVYIGKTVQLATRRWRQHVSDVKRYTFPIHNAIRKHGEDAFTVETIYCAKTSNELNKMETLFIILHQSHISENGYNMTLGGDGGEVPNAATRAKMSSSRKGKKSSPEANAKRSARMVDFYTDPEHRRQTGSYAIGREVSCETRDKIKRSNLGKNKGKHPSPETLVKMRLVQLGRKRTPEQCLNVKNAAKNRKPVSEEARKNMSVAALRRHATK